MAYNSIHPGPAIDAAVSRLNEIGEIRDESNANLAAVEQTAQQVASNAQAAVQAKNEVENARVRVQTAQALVDQAATAATEAAGTATTKAAQTKADREAAQIAASQAKQIALGNAIDDEHPDPMLVYSSQRVQEGFNAFGDATDPDKGAAMVGVTVGTPNASSRTVRQKLLDLVSAKDFSTLAGAIEDVDSIGGGVLRATGVDVPKETPITSSSVTLEVVNNAYCNLFSETYSPTNERLAKRAVRGALPGSHPDTTRVLEQIEARPVGSGKNGPRSADYGLGVSIVKQNLTQTQVAGEIDGVHVALRQGGPDAEVGVEKSDAASFLSDVQNIGRVGYVASWESSSSNINRDFTMNRAINTQIGVQNAMPDSRGGFQSYGFVATSYGGSNDIAYYAQASGSATWGSFFRAMDQGTLRFDVTRTRVGIDVLDGVYHIGSGNKLAHVSQGFWQTRQGVRTVSASYTIDPILDLDYLLQCVGTAPIVITLPADAPVGFRCRVLRRDDLAPTAFAAGAGAALRNASGHTKIRAIWSVVTLEVAANPNGSSATWYLSGDTAA